MLWLKTPQTVHRMGHRVPGVVICPPWFTMAGRANHNVDINDLHSALHVQSEDK